MKNLLVVFALLLAVATMMTPAFGAPLLSEEFGASSTINGSGNGIFFNGDNLDQWLGFAWFITNDGTDYFAKHPELSSDETNLMFRGISATSIAPGASLTLDFEFITEGSRDGIVYVAGLNSGVHSLDPYAGWFDGENPSGWPPADVSDGVVLLKGELDGGLPWTPAHFAFNVPNQYDALVVGFVMGGTSGFRAVDSIDLQIAPVPEPGTLMLLGSGLIGLAGYGKRRFKK